MVYLKKNDLIKVLGNGDIKAPIKITAHKFSAAAKLAIEKNGGEAITV
jgi:large subunit ribosomal protein L15